MSQFKNNFWVILSVTVPMLMNSIVNASTETIIAEIKQTGFARVIVHMDKIEGYEQWSEMVSIDKQRVLVKTAYSQLATVLAENDIKIEKSYSTLPFLGVRVDQEKLKYLTNLEGVSGIHPVLIERKLQIIHSSELKIIPISVKPKSIDISEAWLRGYEGVGQSIAVIDGGFNIDHPMLKNKSVGDACFSASFGGNTFSECPEGQFPEIGKGAASNCVSGSSRCDHGTHVASLAVGNDGVNFGVARAAKFVPLDVFSKVTTDSICFPDSAPCQLTDSLAILDALNYVNENLELYNIGVVNLSIGGGAKDSACDTDPRKIVIDMLLRKGVVTVAAAGNEGLDNAINAPACISGVLAVGALDDSGEVSPFSNFSPLVSVFAPGENLYAADSGGGFAARSGTSMSSALVSGALAVIKSAVPNSSVREIKSAISSKGPAVGRGGVNYFIPKLKVNDSILYLQRLDTDFITNVKSFNESDFIEAKLLFYNSSPDEGLVSLKFFDRETGDLMGSWASEPILPNAISELLLQDVNIDFMWPRQGVLGVYNIFVESDFQGGVQYVLFNEIDESVLNMTSCRDYTSPSQRTVSNVYPSDNNNFSSTLLFYNSGDEVQRVIFSVFDGASGQYLTSVQGRLLQPGSSYKATSSDLGLVLEVDRIRKDAFERPLSQLTIKLTNQFQGHIQHLVKSKGSHIISDFSKTCSFDIDKY